MKYIAFGNRQGKAAYVSVLAEVHDRSPDGKVDFHVINGGWWGNYNPWKGTITVRRSKEGQPFDEIHRGKVLWRGDKLPYAYDYNLATGWVERRIESPIMHRLSMLIDVLRRLHMYRLVVRVEKKPTVKTFNGYENDLDDEIPF